MQSAEPHATGTGVQAIVVAFGMFIFTTVIATALYGPAENSERAFRLLNLWKRDPEPAPPAQRRAERTKRQ
ncbi:hypothetical protein [Streptomyces glomeratus]|uniref:Uncharacterized protein n=1 Tax=Streptomyces glomeratus TaxID=284452 RepID=A0ABP6M4X9_9ACTN|nr:hypothetical protein [Streptomyces glomeratus]MCF1510411.1 hypothetical protein [Streptomyces glomeratus]